MELSKDNLDVLIKYLKNTLSTFSFPIIEQKAMDEINQRLGLSNESAGMYLE